MAATAEYACLRCKQPFVARTADRKRGWARYCSKSCKASKQEQRTGQHAAFQERKQRRADGHEGGEFTDAHLFSNEEHDCSKSDD
ncbi:hypothetical protein [Pseudomonas alvandae]|uniref:hypothetical protein n=1 Tax=Pseudomonas canavaninivorans TaxID=2842348 RepID=UPI003D65F403